MKFLVTGAAGFIGFHLVYRLLSRGDEVVGVDSISDYCSPELKYARLAVCGVSAESSDYECFVKSASFPNYRFVRLDIADREAVKRLFARERYDVVVNLAAQAGVRYSLENPHLYVESNIVGFLNVLDCAKEYGVKHFVYASSSSVYGENQKTPFSEDDRVDCQVSVYAATKRADEVLANVYANAFGLPITGLRFFTVYGPWGRPDMAPMLFSDAIVKGKPIKVFNNGDLSRDFTYVDDIVGGVVRVADSAPLADSRRRADLYNIGCGRPVRLLDFIHTLEEALGCEAKLDFQPMQAGDVHTTYADTSRLEREMGYRAQTGLKEGVGKFVAWYRDFYKV